MTCNECGGYFTQGTLHICGSEVARLTAEVERLTRERGTAVSLSLAAEAREKALERALRNLERQFPDKTRMEDWADMPPCPCYQGGGGEECSCSEEARRISLKRALGAARALLLDGEGSR